MNKIFFTLAILFSISVWGAEEGIRASVSAMPPLPVRNLFEYGSFEDPDILKKMQNSDKTGTVIEVSKEAFQGKQALKFKDVFQKGQLFLSLPKKISNRDAIIFFRQWESPMKRLEQMSTSEVLEPI